MLGRAGWRDDDAELRDSWITAGRGRALDDSDDADWALSSGDDDDDSSASSSTDPDPQSDDDTPSDSEADLDTSALVHDLTRPVRQQFRSTTPDTADSYAPVLVAHQLTTTGSPLTRRRYRAMTAGTATGIQAVSSAIEQRRQDLTRAAWARGVDDEEQWQTARRAELEDERQSFCVVCTVERRSVVLWPCRECL